jgi:hypothetical protein
MATDAVAAEALARAIVPLVKESERKRYLSGEPDSALSQSDAMRLVRARFSKPSQAQVDEQHVTEGVLGISNPALYKKGLRWKDAFTSDKTAVYYVWDKPTSANVWPQSASHFTYYGEDEAVQNQVIPSRNSHTQLANFLFLTTLRRTVRENKNPLGYYTIYQWYGTDGSVDFKIAGAGNANSSYSLVIPGGAIYAPPNQGTSATSGYTAIMSSGIAPLDNATATSRIPSSACSAIHGQFLPGMQYQGRTYIWNDGYSGTGGYSQIPIPGGGGSGFATASPGIWCCSTDASTSAVIGDMGDLQLGSLLIVNGTAPLGQGQHFEVNVWRYNTKQPILYATRSGAVTAAAAAANGLLFACNITTPDYYAVEVLISGDATITSQGIFNFRILQLNTGEFWAHTMTPNLCTLQNFGSIVASRCFGTSILATNTTPDQYLAGTFAGAQPAATTEWLAVVNGQTAPDSYSYIIQTLGERDMNLKRGAYGFVRPTEVAQMKLQSSIITNQNGGAANPYIFTEPLDNQPFYCLVLTSPGGVYIQTIQFSFDHNGEFVTRNQVLDTEASRFTPQQWMLVMEVLTSMEQTYENNNHNVETVLASLGKKAGIDENIVSTILKWAPHVIKAGQLAWQFALPLLAAA